MSFAPSTSRHDNFTDAAFAFAVTLLVIGGSASIGLFVWRFDWDEGTKKQ